MTIRKSWRLWGAGVLVAGVVGCGGGGDGGDEDDDGTTLSGTQQAGVAAFASADTATTARTGESEAEDDPATTSSSSSTSGFTTAASNQIDCNQGGGEAWQYQNQGGEFALDKVDFEATGRFTGNSSLATGSDSELRADDCRNEANGISTRVDGISDTAKDTSFSSDRQISYTVSGGYAGSNPSSPPSVSDRNLDASFVSEIDGTTSVSLRGKIWTCSGCLGSGTKQFVKDLGNMKGDAQRDLGLAASFEIGLNSLTVELGNVDKNETWELAARADSGSSDAEFIVDGRYAFTDSSNSACNFDVTYDTDTSNPLYSRDFPSGEPPTRGQVDVTVNSGADAGTTYSVDFGTGDPDTVKVDGQELSRSDLETDASCSASVTTSS
jgi:hypothetical protein